MSGYPLVEMQSWLTIGDDVGGKIVQPVDDWLDVGSYSMAYFVADVRRLTAGSSVYIETLFCNEDDGYPVRLSGASFLSVGTHYVAINNSTATKPILRYVRWCATGSPGWQATFRILVGFKEVL